MKSKGFTLIELLAVIVILAIIALIATPIILGIINDSKQESQKRSAELYFSAIDLAVARKNLTEGFSPTECRIASGVVTCSGKELEVEVQGDTPLSGTLIFENNKLTVGTELIFKDFKAILKADGTIEIVKLEEDTLDNDLIQENKPQFYGFFNGIIDETLAPENPSTDPPTGKNFYLGYDVKNGKISAAYSCFLRNGKEYCLKGGENGASYEKNKTILDNAFNDVENACALGDYGYRCIDGDVQASADSKGHVSALHNSEIGADKICYFNDEQNSFECFEL